MPEKLQWDQTGEKNFETGISKVVLYPMSDAGEYQAGEAWNGVTSLSESPSGGEASKLYANNTLYATLYSTEEYGATIEAYTAPDSFAKCDGTSALDAALAGITVKQQTRMAFGLCFRTEIGNDITDAAGYKLHLVYGCKASPSERSHSTINDSPEAETLSWTLTTTPVDMSELGLKPSACIEIDSTKVTKENLAKIEEMLYGSSKANAKLPTPMELKALLTAAG